MVDVINDLRNKIMERIEQYQKQTSKHVDDIKKYEEKIIQSKEKQEKLQSYLDAEVNELRKIDEYIEWVKLKNRS